MKTQFDELMRALEVRRERQAKSLADTEAQIGATKEMLASIEAKSPQTRIPGTGK